MKLTRVTVTGADDSINPDVMADISTKYPFVEWGILVSAASQGRGRPRFPSYTWIQRLIDCYEHSMLRLQMSIHICGQWVKNACDGDWSFMTCTPVVSNLMLRATRLQLNFHSRAHRVQTPAFTDWLRGTHWQLILQSDGVNDDIIRQARNHHGAVAVLHDKSGGAGVVPAGWPKPLKGMLNGYAGGLSPRNVTAQLKAIEDVVGYETIWIDAETHLRTDNDRQLSIPLVEDYLIQAKPWVREEA